MRSAVRSILFMLAGLFAAPGAQAQYQVAEPPEDLRRELKLGAFYRKSVIVDGLPILASGKTSDYAVREAAYLVDRMLAGRADLRQALVQNKVRVAVMAPEEFTTAVPEHSDLRPEVYWNKRARGLGATRARPAVSCGEENLLQHPGDPYRGENILIHEFGHAIHEMALREVDQQFDGRLAAAFDQALRDGLWKGTYAATNRAEYWAEGVQSWFDCNQGPDSQHNQVNTRARLRDYDPRLAKLLAEVFRDNDWRYAPPARRPDAAHLRGYDAAKAPRFVWPPELVRAYEALEAPKRKSPPASK